jgi:hypothetical protein
MTTDRALPVNKSVTEKTSVPDKLKGKTHLYLEEGDLKSVIRSTESNSGHLVRDSIVGSLRGSFESMSVKDYSADLTSELEAFYL